MLKFGWKVRAFEEEGNCYLLFWTYFTNISLLPETVLRNVLTHTVHIGRLPNKPEIEHVICRHSNITLM